MNFDFIKYAPFLWRAFQERERLGLLAQDLEALWKAAQPLVVELQKRWPAMDHVARTTLASIVPEWHDKLLKGADAWEPNVRWIQEELTSRGFYHGDVDGKVGPATTQAVLSFQQSVGFWGNDLDGMPGPKTVGAMLAHPV